MKLIYMGKGEWIMGVPAHDLQEHEIRAIATMWDKSISETEALLMSRGLYKAESNQEDKTDQLTAIRLKLDENAIGTAEAATAIVREKKVAKGKTF